MQKCTVDDTHLGHFFACLNVVITMRSHMFPSILSSQRNNYDVGKVCDVGRRARILYFHWCANFGLPINIPWCTTALHSCCPLVMYTQLLYHISSSFFVSLERCIFWCTNAEFTAMVWLELEVRKSAFKIGKKSKKRSKWKAENVNKQLKIFNWVKET